MPDPVRPSLRPSGDEQQVGEGRTLTGALDGRAEPETLEQRPPVLGGTEGKALTPVPERQRLEPVADADGVKSQAGRGVGFSHHDYAGRREAAGDGGDQ